MKLFAYPKAKHRRTLSPPSYNDYRRYKPYLRTEFEGACVYCRTPDWLRSLDSFGVDHYRPRKQFDWLANEYSNLFYVCNTCNRRKGPFWPTSEEQHAGRFVPNPCDHAMYDHLRSLGERVTYHSPAGQWTIDLLLLNDKEVVEFRRRNLLFVQLAGREIQKLKELLTDIDRELLEAKDDARTKLIASRDHASARISEIEQMLNGVQP